MSHIQRNRRRSSLAGILVVLLAGIVLAGCGGSSKSSSSISASTAKTATGPRGQFAARAASLRSCLQKNGVTVAARKPGQRGGPYGPGASGKLPDGTTRSKFQAALKKCGGTNFPRGGAGFNRPAAKQRYAKFAACMSKHGITLPAPNTSGNGPIFSTKGIDTTTAAFKSAYAKCRGELAGSGFAGPGAASPGVGGPGGPGAAAPATGQPSTTTPSP
jgi:hypothetical protein